jgi:trimeric autotransporter adhesin
MTAVTQPRLPATSGRVPLKRYRASLLVAFCLVQVHASFAQTPTETASALPRLVRFGGAAKDLSGNALTGVVGITFALYAEQAGGAALWQETQNLTADGAGHYSALLGSTKTEGLPAELFTTEQAHWVGVQVQGQAEQPRVPLVSAPYALKAVDAETIGGLPPSAFMLAQSAGSAPTGVAAAPASAPAGAHAMAAANAAPDTKTKNYIPVFTSTAGALGNSAIYESGTSIGVGTTTPAATLEVNGGAKVDGTLTLSGDILSSTGVPVVQAPTTGSGNFSAGLGALSPTTTGFTNTALGDSALQANTTGGWNTANGNSALYNNTTGNDNTAVGYDALSSNTSGGYNAAYGYEALVSNTTGGHNVGVGLQALALNTTGSYNTAGGYAALYSNTAASGNTATGYFALFYNTAAGSTATGYEALYANTTGAQNTAAGYQALYANTTGANGTATGYLALSSNTNGQYNTAYGSQALRDNTGSDNTASGSESLLSNTSGEANTASGTFSLLYNTTGSGNIAVGYQAGLNIATTSNNIDIGSAGAAGDNGVIRIGAAGSQNSAYVAGIYGVTTGASNAVPVLIDSNGNLGTVSSSRRYKEDVQDMADASTGLMRLRPVTFRYKQAYADGSKPIQYGLIAEEVAEVYPDLVARSADGQIETVKYQVLDPMLLNELQKQNERIRSLEERLAKVEAALAGTAVTAASR